MQSGICGFRRFQASLKHELRKVGELETVSSGHLVPSDVSSWNTLEWKDS